MTSSSELVEGRTVIYFAFTLVAQTFFFGGYTVLILLATLIMLKRGLKTGPNRALFIISLFMYILSTAYWAYSVADVVARMQFFIDPEHPTLYNQVTKPYDLFNALVLINYALSDGIVVWRAWIICSRDHRKFLYLSIVFLILTAMSITATIALRIGTVVEPKLGQRNFFVEVLNVLQVSNVGTSLISNLTATGIIGTTAWRHRQSIKAAFRKKTKGDQIMIVLLESGLLYCLSGITVVIAMLVHLPWGTLGDLYTPMNVQIAGAYAPVVLLLARNQSSLGDTDFLGAISGLPPPSPGIRAAASRGHIRTMVSTIHFVVNSGTARGSFESELDSDSHHEIEGNTEKKEHCGLGLQRISDTVPEV
ncbi:hypothetical protein C8R44DRAFT_763377 [Mycena epipterygia]|nr:hypothetical protein C8R44DRAFT_763377 [Mycena epipterygia]